MHRQQSPQLILPVGQHTVLSGLGPLGGEGQDERS